VLVAVIAVVGACSAPSSARPTAGVVSSVPGGSASTSSAGSRIDSGLLPHGTYVATIPPGVNAAPGEWKLTVTANGITYIHPEGHSFSPGRVEAISATEIVFAPDPQCPVQEGTPTNGQYDWRVEGNSLSFAVIADSCQDRIDTLTSSEWSLSQ
jgi:hypothetical protein